MGHILIDLCSSALLTVSTSVPLLDAAVGAPITEIPSPRNIFILVSLSCYKCIKLILIKRGLKWFSRG